MAKSNGCMYRIDVLKSGKNVRGRSVVSEEDPTQLLGKGLGFSTLTVHDSRVKGDGSGLGPPCPHSQTPSHLPKLPPSYPLGQLTAMRVAANLRGALPPRFPFRVRERDRRDPLLVLPRDTAPDGPRGGGV